MERVKGMKFAYRKGNYIHLFPPLVESGLFKYREDSLNRCVYGKQKVSSLWREKCTVEKGQEFEKKKKKKKEVHIQFTQFSLLFLE